MDSDNIFILQKRWPRRRVTLYNKLTSRNNPEIYKAGELREVFFSVLTSFHCLQDFSFINVR